MSGVPGMRSAPFPFSVPVVSLPSTESPECLFGSWLLYPSYPFWCGLFSIFSCRESVLVVVGSFLGLFTLMWVLANVSWDKVSLGSFSSTIFLRSHCHTFLKGISHIETNSNHVRKDKIFKILLNSTTKKIAIIHILYMLSFFA